MQQDKGLKHISPVAIDDKLKHWKQVEYGRFFFLKNKNMNILLTIIPSILSGILAYIFTRKKYIADVKKANAEVEANEIENVDKVAKIWRQLSEDITARLTGDIEQLRQENKHIRDRLTLITRENNALSAQMASLQKELRVTKIENEKLIQQLKAFNVHFNGGAAVEQGAQKKVKTNQSIR